MWVPIRFFIALMIFMGTYINYTTRVNLAVSIIAMTKGKSKKIAECTLKRLKEEGKTPAAGFLMRTLRDDGVMVRQDDGGGEGGGGEDGGQKLENTGPRYDWDEKTQGMLLGAYFWGYTITSLPGGAPSEWWGPRWVIFWTCLFSAIFNSLSVFATWINYWCLYACRFIIGALAGFVYPALQALIASWAPPAEKGKFVSALIGNTLGTCLTWPLVGYITSNLGWSWGFHVLTVQILVFCVVWLFVVSDTPAEQMCIKPEEVEFITSAQGGRVSAKKRRAPYKKIFFSLPFWIMVILHSGNLWGLYLQLQGMPKYFVEVLGKNLKDSGVLTAMPHCARIFLGLGFGFLGDYLKKNNVARPVIIRKGFVICSHIIPGILLIGIAFCECNWMPALALLILSMSINGAAVMTNLQNPQDLAPNFAGTLFGLMSCIGGTTGFLGPLVTSLFIKDYNGVAQWAWVFILGGGIYIGTGIVFILFGSVEEQPWNSIED